MYCRRQIGRIRLGNPTKGLFLRIGGETYKDMRANRAGIELCSIYDDRFHYCPTRFRDCTVDTGSRHPSEFRQDDFEVCASQGREGNTAQKARPEPRGAEADCGCAAEALGSAESKVEVGSSRLINHPSQRAELKGPPWFVRRPGSICLELFYESGCSPRPAS